MDRLYEDVYEVFGNICKGWIDTFPKDVIEKFGIEDSERFCDFINRKVRELLEFYSEDKQRFTEEVFKIGEFLYDKGISVAVIVDITNEILLNFSTYVNLEKLSLDLNTVFVEFVKSFQNIVSLSYINKSLKIKRDLLNRQCRYPDIRDVLVKHFDEISRIVEKNFKVSLLCEEKCPVKKYMKRLDFKIIAKKINTYEEFLKIHSLIHIYLKIFKGYFEQRKYLPAYLVMITLYFLIERLTDSFSLVESYRKNLSVKDLLDFLLREGEPVDIFILDPSEISFINKVYGYEKGDEIFSLMKREIESFFSDRLEKVAVFKCQQGVICTVVERGLCEREDYEKIFVRIKEKVSNVSKFSPVAVDVAGFVVRISSLEKLKVEDLKKILRSLNRESKKDVEKLLFLEVGESFKKFEFLKDISDEIRRKIETGNFKLAIQGIFDVQTEKPVHYEVLLRFLDDEGNIVPAYKFIDYIYEFRLIHLLDVAVLKKILENSEVFSSKSIYVNISPVTFKLSSSLSEVERLVGDIRANGINIGFEITEQAIVEDIDLIVDVMRGRDIPVGIDDFGTGYASFSKFIDFVEAIDVEILKVDGSYIKKLVKENSSDKAEKVIKAIISMSRSLGIKTVAEFVENKEILEKIKQFNVDYGQGYLFMKPKVVV